MWKKFYFVFILKYTLALDNNEKLIHNYDLSKTNENLSWKHFMTQADWSTNELLKRVQPYLTNIYSTENVSEPCVQSLKAYFDGIETWEPWAIQMADTTGRIPSGLLTGTRTDFGSFYECLNVKAKSKSDVEIFQGQFCMVGFKSPLVYPMSEKTWSGKHYVEEYGYPPDWISHMMTKQEVNLKGAGIWLGTCLPSTCSQQDIYNIFSAVSKSWAIKVSISDCQTDEPKKWSTSAVISGCILSTLFGVCLLGTYVDFRDKKAQDKRDKAEHPVDEGLGRKILKAFSLSANSEKVFQKNKKHSLDCLNGIRFFLSFWVIISHIFMFTEEWKERKYTSIHYILDLPGILALFTVNAYLNMENFTFISGFLMAYTLKKKLDQNKEKVNVVEFVIQRYWRLMPPFLFVLVLLFFLPVTSSGPIWNSSWEAELEKCRSTWAWNMVLLQNTLHVNDYCMLHSWFIGCLFQMQVAALILMLLTYRFPKIGVVVGSLVVAACISIDYNTSATNNFRRVDLNYVKDYDMLKDFISKIYIRPFNHFPSYLLGMVVACIFLKYKDIKIPQKLRILLWITTIVLYIMVLTGIWMPTENTRIISWYYALRTIIWALCTAWVIYSCVTGHGGIFNRIFSMEILVPLSRISYCIYLLHPLILTFKNASLRERMYIGVIDHVFDTIAITVISIITAFIGYIMVEEPFNSIYDLLHQKYSSESLKKTTMFNAKKQMSVKEKLIHLQKVKSS